MVQNRQIIRLYPQFAQGTNLFEAHIVTPLFEKPAVEDVDRTQCLVQSGAGSSPRFKNDNVGIVRAVEDGTALVAQVPQKFVLGAGKVALNKIALATGKVDIAEAIEVFMGHKLHRSTKNEYAVELIPPKKSALCS
ncbi:MAG TPA: hypothetical protein EYG11_02960 [Candidatus Latescibacteria bacterium]|nr:hypothetical protein [Candidatus Handelsmanbacteria bacterium]HIL07641.1 hypothetical protein [Candidatus Latescibacterota bacterium]